jgi:two-component system sensor histidine kinase DegS
VLFALLFPKPLAILPPLLALPVTARLDQLLDRSPTAVEILTLLWYLALNFIVVYVLVYLNQREVAAHREVVELTSDLKDLAVVEERNRLAREIHDGLGANLSSLIIQAEYLTGLTKDTALLSEIGELKSSAEEAIEELRRSLRMMREDFDLAGGVEDYVKTFRDRTQLDVRFEKRGLTSPHLPPETSLALFRVLQETLSNALKHAEAKQIEVQLHLSPDSVALSVKDDGRGFDATTPRPGHYGLTNLRERAMQIGAEVNIDSKPGEGAHITFSVPLTS